MAAGSVVMSFELDVTGIVTPAPANATARVRVPIATAQATVTPGVSGARRIIARAEAVVTPVRAVARVDRFSDRSKVCD